MKKLIIILALIFSFSISFALDVPAIDGYILDQTDSLTTWQEQALESKIYKARQDTDIEMWILIINSLEGEDIFNYSHTVATERWVWDKDKSNWLVMVFAMEDRERRIQVGYGLEWIITDSIAKRFWERNIATSFKEWLYFEWINNTLQDIIDYIKQDPTALAYINSENNSDNSSYNDSSSGQLNMMFIIGLFMLIKMLVVKYDPKKKKSTITKQWRIAFAVIWAVASLVSYIFFLEWDMIVSGLLWYGSSILSIGILILMWSAWWTWGTGGSWFGWFSSWGSSSGSSWGSSFGWFWGGSFGWWGAGWKR